MIAVNVSSIRSAEASGATGDHWVTIRFVEGIINQYIGINRASGGAVWGAGTSTSDSIPANLSNGEYVFREAAARSFGYGNLDHMNRTGTLPPTVMPTMPRMTQGNDNSALLAEIRALRQENSQLLRMQIQTTGEGARNTNEAIRQGNRSSEQMALASRRQSAKAA